MEIIDKIDRTRVPKHVAVIMDGNGRWARQKGEHRIYGHISGVESVRETLVAASEIGVEFLTLYAFSSENWNRPEQEVEALMDLLVKTIASETNSLNENGVRLMAIGSLDSLPQSCSDALKDAIEKTKNNTRINLVLALSYGSRQEILEAVQKVAASVLNGETSISNVNESMFAKYLYTANIPDPELLIRTSGEVRISNFLLWQLAYTEMYFTDVMWPDFNRNEFYKAILDFQLRERRFGLVSEQVNAE
jgi:undecaprenyl diphosphate synthase